MASRKPRARVFLAASLTLLAAGCAPIPTLSTQQALERMNVASTKIYAADGSLIANLHGEINRDIVKLEDIPRHVQQAVVSIEDERFWRHGGVDVISIGRAFASNVGSAASADRQLQGGSTISQQLVKNIYFQKPERTLKRKMTEARVTFQFERNYDKPKILEMYLNTIHLGRGVYGFQTAARSYFHKDVTDLTLGEAAFLAGIIHEPASYDWGARTGADRERRREASLARRRLVLRKMAELGFIASAEADRTAAARLEVFPRADEEWRYPYFVDLVLRQLGVLRSGRAGDVPLDPRFENVLGATHDDRSRNVYRGGLRIYTTLDPEAQSAAEDAVAKVLPATVPRLSAALAAIEPRTGYVRAVVGGKNYYPDCDDSIPLEQRSQECRLGKVNLALGRLGGGSGRQPGSSFKPIVLATALQRGVSLRQGYSSAPFTQEIPGSEPWKVRNYEGEGSGHTDLVEGTVHSVNAVYAHLEVEGVGDGKPLQGSARVAEMARKLGIGFETPGQAKQRCKDQYAKRNDCLPADSVPAIALGAKEVAPIEMASAYATFANEGVYVQPTAVARITDASGRVLYEADPVHARVLPKPVALGLTHVLGQVIARGTGVKARLSRPAAGKTGTSQEWRDAWFAGYVPQLTAAVWVGNPESARESMTPANGYPFRIVGGTFPAMIWHYFMTQALADVPVQAFPPAPSDVFGPVSATPAPIAAVPDVLGMSREEASRALVAGGFDVAQEQCLAKTVPEGTVVRQTPGGGVEIPTGSTVTICVSTRTLPMLVSPGSGSTAGSSRAAVPNVIGASLARARSDIAQAGFDSEVRRECDASGNAQAGDVWKQSPAGGSVEAKGSIVTVWYNGAAC